MAWFPPNPNNRDDRRSDPTQLGSIDWKKRFDELSAKDWDPKTQFTGISRLGDEYHPIEPFFKFNPYDPVTRWSDHVWYPFFVGSAFAFSHIVSNGLTRKPLLSRFPITVGLTILGAITGELVWRNMRMKAEDRDSVLVHYMLLHEDDFEKIPRKKFKDLTLPWIPFRMQ